MLAGLLAACSPDEQQWRVNGAAPSDDLTGTWTVSFGNAKPSQARSGSLVQGASATAIPPQAGGATTSGAATSGAAATPPAPAAPAAPATLPTWVQLDWAAFPVDRGPSYSATRVWEVSMAGSDQGAGTAASPLRTISAALDRAQPGEMVRVQAGTYSEGAPGRNYSLQMARDNVVLTGAPGALVTVVPASGEQRFGVMLQGSHLTVNGITLQGFHPAIHFGRADVTQKDIVLSNLTAQGVGNDFTDGIATYVDNRASGQPAIEGLLLKNVSILGHGLSFSCGAGPCNSMRFEDVKVVANGGGAGNSGADGMAIEKGDNLLFLRCDITGTAADGIDTKATRVVVWDSHVHDVARNGVKLWWGGDVVNTSIQNTGADAALVVKQGDRFRLLHSSIVNATLANNGYAMTLRYDDNGPIQVDIEDSVISNTGGPIYVSSAAKLSVQNTVMNASANGILLVQGPLQVTPTAGALMLGADNLIADPGLDASGKPLPTSILIDKGRSFAPLYPAEDITGGPRVRGGGPDIGPFETR